MRAPPESEGAGGGGGGGDDGGGPLLSTTKVKSWVAASEIPFVAVKVKVKTPLVLNVPDKVPVPFPWSLKLIPGGRPLCPSLVETLKVGTGKPLVVTLKVFTKPE